MKKLDQLASIVIISVLAVLAGVIYLGNHMPVTVHWQYTGASAQISPYGSILFEFSRPVVSDQVESLFEVTPTVAGRWEWSDDRHARWMAATPFTAGQSVQLRFKSGTVGQNGETLQVNQSWQATIRQPLVVVSTAKKDSGQELYTLTPSEGQTLKPLTQTGGAIFDYTPSPDGEAVVFSVVNNKKGTDLWEVQRDGTNQRLLLDCGADRCSTPAWSPISREMAYSRESAGIDPNGPKGAPRVWLLNLDSGQSTPLFSDPQKIGYGPTWSPDGKWLTIWNGTEGGIQVVDRKTGETIFLKSSNGESGSWSRDSKSLYYSDIVLGDSSFRNVVLKADIESGTISTILGGNVEGDGLSVNHPVCNPQNDWVAAAVQPDVRLPGKELVLLNPGSKDGISVMDDLTRLPGFFNWNPTGDRLVFQQDILGSSEYSVEVWVWDQKGGKAYKIADGARFPHWLP